MISGIAVAFVIARWFGMERGNIVKYDVFFGTRLLLHFLLLLLRHHRVLVIRLRFRISALFTLLST